MAQAQAETLGTDLAGRYRFIGEIGRGGMANVYLTATRGALGGFQKLVVIKILRAERSAGGGEIDVGHPSATDLSDEAIATSEIRSEGF